MPWLAQRRTCYINCRRASSHAFFSAHASEQCASLHIHSHAAKSCSLPICPFSPLYATDKHHAPRKAATLYPRMSCWQYILPFRSGRLLHGHTMVLTQLSPHNGADQTCCGAQIQNIRRPSLRPVEPEVQGVWAVPYAAALHDSVEDIHEVDHILEISHLSPLTPC